MQTAPKAASLARIPRSSLHFRSLPRTTSFHTNTIAVTGAIIAPLTFAIMQQPMATASVRLFFRLGSRYHRKVYKTAVKNSRTIRQSLFREPASR